MASPLDIKIIGGQVLDGTGAPAQKLDVNGDIRVQGNDIFLGTAGRYIGSSSTAYVDFSSNHATVSGMRFLRGATIQGYVYSDDNYMGLLNNAGSWAFRIPKITTGPSTHRNGISDPYAFNTRKPYSCN